ncbi:hypothetical protein JCM8208_007815 [Rhodotorula glutinis]
MLYPLSFFADPGRTIDSYFPLASTSSSTPPPTNRVQHAQAQPQGIAASREALRDAASIDSSAHSAPSERRSSSPVRLRDDQSVDPRKRPRVRPVHGPVGSVIEGQAVPASDEVVVMSREAVTGNAAERAVESSSRRPSTASAPEQQVEQRSLSSRRRSLSTSSPEFALPETFSSSALKPPLAGLRFPYYMPYLRDEPAEPKWSSSYCATFIQFACSVAHPPRWSSRPERLVAEKDAPAIVQEIRTYQPYKDLIRRCAPLCTSRAADSTTHEWHTKFLAMRDVMRWIWEDESLELEHVAGMILTAPISIHMIIRTFASMQRFTNVRRIAEEDLAEYLSRHPSPSPRERAALVLLRWFQRRDAPRDRRYRFFIERNGRLRRGTRGHDGWEWWFAPTGPGGLERREGELDEWERDVVRREGWPS